MLDYLKEYIDKHNQVPRVRDFFSEVPFTFDQVRSVYGTWNQFVAAAGFTPRSRKKYTRQGIIQLAQKHYTTNGYIGVHSVQKDSEMPTVSTIENYFGSFNQMLSEAGIPTNDKSGTRRRPVRSRKVNVEQVEANVRALQDNRNAQKRNVWTKDTYSDEDLLSALRRCYEKHGAVTVRILNADKELPSSWPYERRFGTFRNAKALAGVPMAEGMQIPTVAHDGHICDSAFEALVDNMLNEMGIEHEHHVKYPNSNYNADFRCGNLYIEAAGVVGIDSYDARLKKKREHANANGQTVLVVSINTPMAQIREQIQNVIRKSNLTSKTALTAGNSLEPGCYNVAGNGERECLKNSGIGQSATKLLSDTTKENAQRPYGRLQGDLDEDMVRPAAKVVEAAGTETGCSVQDN